MATLAQRVTGVTKTLGGGLSDTAAELERSQASSESLKANTLATQTELNAA